MNIPQNNRRLGRIVYSKSSSKKPRNFSIDKSKSSTSVKVYDKLIQKTKKTIDECKKQLNENSYFTNDDFYNQHERTQLLKFNKGLSDYRYNNLNPLITSNEFFERNPNCISYNLKDINRNLYNKLYNSKENTFEDINNINEINNLRKQNIKNEQTILEREKQIESLVNKIKEMEQIINNYRNEKKKIDVIGKNSKLIENNYKEEKNKNEMTIKKLNGEIKEYLRIIEELNQNLNLMAKDLDKIKQENTKLKSNFKNNNIADKVNKELSKLKREFNDSCRLNY
jgi:hypothetical protein